MGVHGLWELLSPVGVRVANSHVRHKRVAVDASIWLTQFVRAMREAEGAMLPNAHLLGIFRRCCKLLFLAVKPVLVFDGASPAIKRRTRDLRRAQRDNDAAKLRRLAERLLQNQLKGAALRAVADARRDGRKEGVEAGRVRKRRRVVRSPSPDQEVDEDEPEPPSQRVEPPPGYDLSSESSASFETREARRRAASAEDSSPEIRVELPDDLADLDDEALAGLPPNVQAAVFTQIRQRQRAHHRAQVMTRQHDPAAFSRAQIEGFMRNTRLNRRIKGVRKKINDRTGAHSRIASDSQRMYLLEEGEEGDFESGGEGHGEDELGDGEEEDDDADGGEMDILKRIRLERERREPAAAENGTGNANAGKETANDTGVGWASKLLHTGGSHRLGGLLEDDAPAGESSSEDMAREEVRKNVVDSAANAVDSDSDEWEDGVTGETLPTRTGAGEGESAAREGESDRDLDVQRAILESMEAGVAGMKRKAAEVEEDEIVPRLVQRSPEVERRPRSPVREGGPGAKGWGTLEVVSVDEGEGNARGGSVELDDEDLAMLITTDGDDDKRASRRQATDVEDEITPRHPAQSEENAPAPKRNPKRKERPESNSEDEITPVRPRPSREYATKDGAGDAVRGFRDTKGTTSNEIERKAILERIAAEMTAQEPSDGKLETGKDASLDRDVPENSRPSASVSPSVDADTSDRSLDRDRAAKQNNPEDAAKRDDDIVEIDAIVPKDPSPGIFEDDPMIRNVLAQSEDAAAFNTSKIFEAENLLSVAENANKADEPARSADSSAFDAEALNRLHADLETERAGLVQQQQAQSRVVERVTDEMIAETRDLLRLFGIPFIEAPMEAEAQCAFFDLKGLVDGVITEDSDAFLFGARTVYRRLFAEGKFAEEYRADAIRSELGVDRARLIRLAHLLGSDYTPGVRGIGIVNSMEVLEAFPGDGGLAELARWADGASLLEKEPDAETMAATNGEATRKQFCWKHRNVKRGWVFHKGFPSAAVDEAYWKPAVHASEEPFKWKPVDFGALERFCYRKFGWDKIQFDNAVGPLRDELRRRGGGPEQRSMHEFFQPHRFAKIKSRRLQRAVRGIAGVGSEGIMADLTKLGGKEVEKETGEEEDDEEDDEEVEEEDDDGEEGAVTKANLMKVKAVRLREELKRLGKDSTGTVPVLRLRLKRHLDRL